MVEIWVAVITAVVSPVLIIVVKHRLDRPRRRAAKTIDGLRRLGEMYSRLGDLRRAVSSSRVVLLRADNSGGVPQPGAKVYTSVIHESCGDNADSVRKAWYRQPVDSAYAHVLSTLASAWEPVTLRPDDMEPGDLRDFYVAHGIAWSYVVPLLATKDAFYYLSATWDDEEVEETEEFRDAYRAHLGPIREALELSEEGSR